MVVVTVAMAACEPGGDASDAGDMTTTTPPGEEPVTEEHGHIKLRLVPTPGSEDDWFAGSNNFSVNLQYDACLEQFYKEHPSWRERESNGEPIFDEWHETLCNLSVPDRIDCSIETIAQEFSATSQLLVRYTPTAVDALGNGVVVVGPLPTQAMAGCVPIVRLEAGAVVGTEDIGEKIWQGMSYSADTATTNQDEIIIVEVGAFVG